MHTMKKMQTSSVAAIANNDTHGVADAGGAVTPEAVLLPTEVMRPCLDTST